MAKEKKRVTTTISDPKQANPNPKTAPKKDAKKSATDKTMSDAQKTVGRNFDTTKLTPEQIAQLELEEAIKNSSNAAAHMQELKNPLSIKGCLLNLLMLVILTIAATLVVSYFWVDKFNVGTILLDILTKFGIVDLWHTIRDAIVGVFTPKDAIEIFSILI